MTNTVKLRRWALFTVAFYVMALAGLTAPLIMAAFWKPNSGSSLEAAAVEVSEIYLQWPYWAVLGVLALLQVAVLLLPLNITRQRPVPHRSWRLLAVAAGLMMALLVAGLTLTVGEVYERMVQGGLPEELLWVAIGLGILSWFVWGLVFWRFSRAASDETSRFRRVLKWLLAGSLLEFLVAVPSHVYVRHKDDCCGGFGTFWGLAAGLAGMLFAFGPGVFFLFLDRIRRLQRGEAGEGVPILGKHSRDAFCMGLCALSFLLLPLLALPFVPQEDAEFSAATARLSFIVLGLAACAHAVWAGLRKEPLWGLMLALGGLLVEAMLLLGICWAFA